jgi:pyruvate dehydrogenase E1 component alpha subunit
LLNDAVVVCVGGEAMSRLARRALEPESAYEALRRVRAVEDAHAALWAEGLISGEFHSGVGEEAVAVGVVAQLRDGDAMALDHRGTPALVARGVDPRALLLEAAGHEDGVGGGYGGHMHLVAPEVLAVTDGIVGSSGPTACGMALAARSRGGDAVAVAFFGEGAANQGMLLESLNLAVAWRLPVLFVCKDSGWAITTRSRRVTGGSLVRRARAFGMPGVDVDGWKIEVVTAAAKRLVERARAGAGPGFLLARVYRPGGHFAGDPMLRLVRDPLHEGALVVPGLLAAARATPGAAGRARARAGGDVVSRLAVLAWQHVRGDSDPVTYARRHLTPAVSQAVDARVSREVDTVLDEVRAALRPAGALVGGAR